MENEKELVEKILAGDQAAQTLFYEQQAKRLFPVCVHFLGHEDADAEDIIQETFLVAFRKLGEFEHRSSLYTWLNHICVNLCFERLRRRKRTLSTLAEDLERLTLPNNSTQEGEKREEEVKKARLEALDRLVKTMSEKCREVLERRDRQGHSYIDIARALKMPMGTVMSQLGRCRKALKHLMENELKEAKAN